MTDVTSLLLEIQTWIVGFGLKVVAAIVLLLVGLRIARWGRRTVERLMGRAAVDATLIRFTGNATHITLVVITLIIVLGQVGVETASFIAVIGSAGLAIGLALQGSLSNLAAGVLLILFRPFQVGHYIEAVGAAGTVEEIQLFTTLLVTTDNRAVIVPNSKLVSDVIINYSTKPQRRVDLVIGVSYDDNLERVRQILTTVLKSDPRILADPPTTIGVLQLAESSVNFAVRPWVNTPDYWPVYFQLQETIKVRLEADGISLPFPQRTLHMVADPSAAAVSPTPPPAVR